MSTNIKVCVRVRPENVRERESAQKPVVAVLDESMLIFDPVYDESGMLQYVVDSPLLFLDMSDCSSNWWTVIRRNLPLVINNEHNTSLALSALISD